MALGHREGRWDKSLLRKYTFPTEPVQRLSYADPQANELISAGKPVVLTDSNMVASALHWDLEFLEENLGEEACSVYESDNHLFKYYDEKKLSKHKSFVPPTRRHDMIFPDFASRVRNALSDSGKRYYLQQTLTEGVSKKIVLDFLQFNWAWLNTQQKRNNWGPLTSNLLLVGMPGNITPCHYDEQENFLSQVQGYKRVILFSPSEFECLYPYPVHHPHDRQSQVDFENPNYESFPLFRNVKGYEAILGPGDVLYLPMYWFHHVESLIDTGMTTSITFWYMAAPTGKIEYPLTSQQKMAMMRNIEKMVTEALGDHDEVAPFLQNMVLGRYTT